MYEQDNRALRYLRSIRDTIRAIRKERPQVVAAQNPSIVLALVVIWLKHLFHYLVVIDSHNSGLFPKEGTHRLLMIISRWIQRHADLTIVTNPALRLVVAENGGRGCVLPDRLPSIERFPDRSRGVGVVLVFICTYNDDEPFREVVAAAGQLPEGVTLRITGKYGGKIDPALVPKCVTLLGYLPEEEYWTTLSSADIIVDLTRRENCLVCGAYEAVALEKPLILSDTAALRSYFSKGCVYVEPTTSAIARGMQEAIERRRELGVGVKELKQELLSSWDRQFEACREHIERLVARKDIL